jgi:S1-C subfamily serine protease
MMTIRPESARSEGNLDRTRRSAPYARLAICVALAVSGRAHSAPAAGFAAERVRPALCGVLVDGHLACSGFFVTDRGTCLTCAHALVGTRRIELLMACGRRIAATRAGTYAARDTAVLRAALGPEERVAFLRLAASPPRVGASVILAGSPLYRHGLFLAGTVARGGPAFEYNPELKTYVRVMYVSGMTPRGTSGGPWLDESGKVIGLQSGGIARGDTLWGVAFVVPASELRPVAKPSPPPARVGDLGAAVEELWEHPPATVARFAGAAEEGLLIARLLRGGACDGAGLVPGQLIVAADGSSCRFRRDLLELIRRRRPGDRVRLDVLAAGEKAVERRQAVIRLGSAAEASGLAEIRAPGG